MLINHERPCGECKECCKGHLEGKAHGHEFKLGKPCFWLQKQGCGIYQYRPTDPCKTFICEWKVNPDFPKTFRPDLLGVIFVNRVLDDGSNSLDVVSSVRPVDADILHFILLLLNSHKYNQVRYEYNGTWYEIKR